MKSKEIYLPIILFLLFFVAQVFFYSHEILLTILSVLICGAIFVLKYNKVETRLFIFGLMLGCIIEIGLGQIARTQYWNYASLFGVPYWLPIVWGIGFVIITRTGILIRRIKPFDKVQGK